MKVKISQNKKTKLVFLFLILCNFLLLSCTPTQKNQQSTIWHQQYIAIETNQTHQFVTQNLQEAITSFGPPITPIKAHHVRQSNKRLDYEQLRQADIQNWPNVASTILTNLSIFKNTTNQHLFSKLHLDTFSRIAAGGSSTFAERQDIITILNSHLNSQFLQTLSLQKAPPDSLKEQVFTQLFASSILPMPPPRRVHEGLELCEVTKEQTGTLILYVSVAETDLAFHAQLSHEAFHMLNPYLFDWYMEGLCNVFAEKMSEKFYFPWQKVQNHLESNRKKDPYSISFYMMKELKSICGEDFYTILQYAKWSNKRRNKMYLDMNTWLKTLPEDKQGLVAEIIQERSSSFSNLHKRRNSLAEITFPH